jgi:DMSO/TMAO reductase YedYZ molybdopterin-dependent catalytic subunit
VNASLAAGEHITPAELALATRNHGLPLEALRYDVTPVGLHYLLTHYDIPLTDEPGWRLTLTGRVTRSPAWTVDDLRRRPARTVRVTMECAGNGRARLRPRPVSQPWLVEAVGTAEWTGVPLRDLLAEAGVADDAVEVVFTGADHGVERGVEQDYQRSLPLADAMRGEVLVAYAMNGGPLPPQHGAPLRLVVPGWYGMASVKWLHRIEVVDRPFEGFQNAVAYRLRQQAGEPGVALTRIAPRALIVPPGYPDFLSRERTVRAGPVPLTGRAWSGHAPIAAVDVSADGGRSWAPATVGPAAGRWAWREWRHEWSARPGRHVLTVRARDEAGNVQPSAPAWNLGGFANNDLHRVPVTCVP